MVDTSYPEKPTVLLVDDSPDDLDLMHECLKDLYGLKIANNGEQALRVATTGTLPDIILLDIMMPVMDGYETCRHLKADSQTRDIPVIFLTAKAEIEDQLKGFDLGAVDYITKPISPPIVLARVQTHLHLNRVRKYLTDKNAFLEDEVRRRMDQVLAVRKQAEEVLRKQAEELRARNDELELFNIAATGRELRMIELKQEINELCRRLGEPPRHAMDQLETDSVPGAGPAPAPPGGGGYR